MIQITLATPEQLQAISQNDSITRLLAIIAIIVSVVSIAVNYFQNSRILKCNMESKFYDDIFYEPLNKSLPIARSKIYFKDEHIDGTDELQILLSTLRKKSSYFQFSDRYFYNRFKAQAQLIEDNLVQAYNHVYDREKEIEFYKSLDKEMRKLYRIITHRIFGYFWF